MTLISNIAGVQFPPPEIVHTDRWAGLLADQLQMGFWRMTPRGGQVYWSERVFEIYGIAAQQAPLSLERAMAFIVPEDRAMAATLLQQTLHEKHSSKVIFRIDTASGIKLVEYTAGVVVVHGEVAEMYGTVVDVTGRSTKDAGAVGRSLLVRTMMKNVPAAIAVFDTHMNYLAVSDYWIAGHKTAVGHDLIGRNHYVVRPEVTDQHKGEHQRVLAGETLRSPRAYMKDSSGKTVPQLCVMCPWHKIDGSIGGMMMMLGAVDSPIAHPVVQSARPTREELLNILKDLH